MVGGGRFGRRAICFVGAVVNCHHTYRGYGGSLSVSERGAHGTDIEHICLTFRPDLKSLDVLIPMMSLHDVDVFDVHKLIDSVIGKVGIGDLYIVYRCQRQVVCGRCGGVAQICDEMVRGDEAAFEHDVALGLPEQSTIFLNR